MAHGYLTPTDIRSDRNYLGAIAGAIGSRIKKSSDMAASERRYASKQAERGGTSLEEAGIGRGYFFKRALGSSFGGDRIARTRGRFETDPGPGRDPSGTQASRFRGGFDYGVSNTIKSPTGGALANIVSPVAGAGASGFPGGGAGPAINPDILGGALVTSQFRQTKQNTNVAVDTTATEVKDLAGILNQIGQIIVSSSNSTIQAVDSVQQVNVQVVQGIKSLGQLQVQIAQRQEMLQLQAAQEQQQMMSRMLAASEKSQFTQDDFSSNLTPEGSGAEGGKGGGFIGGLVNRLSDFFGMRMGGPGIGGGGAGFSATAGGVSKALGTNKGSMVNRMGGNFLARNATRMFGRGGMMPFLRPIFKRIPIFGGLIDFAVSLALGEPVGRAAAKAVGATLGAGLGSLIPVPGVGTIAGGILGDFAGGAIYDAVTGGGGKSSGGGEVKAFASGGIINQPTLGMVGESGAEGIFPLEGSKGRKTFIKFGEGILEAQRRNKYQYAKIQAEGLSQYYDKEDGWTKGWKKFTDWIKSLGGQLSRWIFGGGQTPENPYGRDPNQGLFNGRSRGLSGSAFVSSASSADPMIAKFLPTARGGRPPTLTPGNSGTTTNFAEQRGDRKHQGVDIGTDVGQRVLAIEDGKVVDAYPDGYGEYGGAVIIEHADRTRYVYGHVTPASDIKVGDTVKAGKEIAKVVYYRGPQGQDYTHLHLERINAQDKKIDAIRHLMGAEDLSAPNAAAANAPSPNGNGGAISPSQVIPLPDGLSMDPAAPGPKPFGYLNNKAISARSNLLKDMSKFQYAVPFANRKQAKSKGEKLRIPGVGSIVKDRGLIGDWFNKFFNTSGKEITAQQFEQLRKKQQEANSKILKQYNEMLGLEADDRTMDPWASASADTGNGVLRASAAVESGKAGSGITFVNMNNNSSNQQSADPILAASLAGASAGSKTPRYTQYDFV